MGTKWYSIFSDIIINDNLKDTGGRNAIMHAENEEIRKAIIDAVKKRNEKTGENVVIQGFERE